MYSIIHSKHTVYTKIPVTKFYRKDLTIFLYFNIETGFKFWISSIIPVKILITLMKLLNMLTCNPVKLENIQNQSECHFDYHPCEYIPLISFNCIINSKNMLIFFF